MTRREKIEHDVRELVSVPAEFSEADPMHFSVKSSDLVRIYGSVRSGVSEITKALNAKFPWAMAMDYGSTFVAFTLA